MFIYLDESGDLGFSPGGSKFFVITFVATNHPDQIKRAIKHTKNSHGFLRKYEIKGNKTPENIRKDLLYQLSQANIEIYSIIMNKSNVLPHLKSDTNKLYNYTACLLLSPYICTQQVVTVTIDKRILKVGSGMKLNEYLEYKVLYERQTDVRMTITHEDSKLSSEIQAVDVICNSIFKKYETKNYDFYNIIRGRIVEERRLFF